MESGGVFEIWEDWGGSWRLATKSGGDSFTFAASSVKIRKVLVICREKGTGWLKLGYSNSINPAHNGVYGASTLLHGYEVRVANIKFNHDTSSSMNDAINRSIDKVSAPVYNKIIFSLTA